MASLADGRRVLAIVLAARESSAARRENRPVRIVAIVQARIGSARLPGKVLANIGGRPALAHVLARAAAITPLDDLVLAIPAGSEDDALEHVGESCGVHVIRGDRDDVLSRYWTAAAASGPRTPSSASPAIVPLLESGNRVACRPAIPRRRC